MASGALWHRLASGGMRTLALMGMAKNTGKTVAMNHLLAHAAAARAAVGVTSIGRDGEALDQVFNFPKPPVLVHAGTLVATARATLDRCKARWKLLGPTGIDSPMGEIVIVKVLDGGEMEVAGASRGADQIQVIAQLRQCGAQWVMLDGALGRSQHASPAIADGVILATGAALGGGIQDVIRKTRDRLAILGIATVDEATRLRCAPLFANGGVGIWGRDGAPLFRESIATINAGPALLRHIDCAVGTIALSGAVGRSLWQALESIANRHSGLKIVVADGTRLFVEHADLAALRKLGATVLGFRQIRIAAITLNPFSPMGGYFDAEEFTTAARAAFPEIEVRDVMRQEQSIRTGEV